MVTNLDLNGDPKCLLPCDVLGRYITSWNRVACVCASSFVTKYDNMEIFLKKSKGRNIRTPELRRFSKHVPSFSRQPKLPNRWQTISSFAIDSLNEFRVNFVTCGTNLAIGAPHVCQNRGPCWTSPVTHTVSAAWHVRWLRVNGHSSQKSWRTRRAIVRASMMLQKSEPWKGQDCAPLDTLARQKHHRSHRSVQHHPQTTQPSDRNEGERQMHKVLYCCAASIPPFFCERPSQTAWSCTCFINSAQVVEMARNGTKWQLILSTVSEFTFGTVPDETRLLLSRCFASRLEGNFWVWSDGKDDFSNCGQCEIPVIFAVSFSLSSAEPIFFCWQRFSSNWLGPRIKSAETHLFRMWCSWVLKKLWYTVKSHVLWCSKIYAKTGGGGFTRGFDFWYQ